VFFDNQKERIINLDETDGTLDESNKNRGGRPPMVFTSPDVPGGGTAANKSGYSSTIICGSNAAGEALPPHFQLKSLAQQDSTQRISIDWFLHAVSVVGKFGFDEPKELPTTFGLNEKGGGELIRAGQVYQEGHIATLSRCCRCSWKACSTEGRQWSGAHERGHVSKPSLTRCLPCSWRSKYNSCDARD